MSLLPDTHVAVLIDFENVGLDSVQALLDEISNIGRIIVKRAYADWSVARNKRDQLLELGFEAVHHFRSSSNAKNSSDICLAIDAIDLLYRSPVDTFVIVSSDTDFVPLVNRVRAAGKTVVGAGRRATASRTLVTSCDRYIYLDELGKPAATNKRAGLSPQAESLLVRAVLASMDSEGKVLAAKLHNTILRIDPSFSFKGLGYKTFTQFLAASSFVRISKPEGLGDVVVDLAPGSEAALLPVNGAPSADGWSHEVDAAWSERAKTAGATISGSWAAAEAARVLGLPKLSASRYRSLQGLLDASEYLKARWCRDGSVVKRR